MTSYAEIKTLKAQVEHVLSLHTETRNSDAELTRVLCSVFHNNTNDLTRPAYDPVKIATSVERCRRKFNEDNRFLPTLESVARQRKMNMDEWRVALGYPTLDGHREPPSVKEQKRVHTYPSKTKRGIYYNAVETEYGLICDCPSYQFRHACKHIKLAEMEVMRASMTPLF
ncbi:MAG: hypothetical protein AB1352_03575 [Patescibacteria group bacterium]